MLMIYKRLPFMPEIVSIRFYSTTHCQWRYYIVQTQKIWICHCYMKCFQINLSTLKLLVVLVKKLPSCQKINVYQLPFQKIIRLLILSQSIGKLLESDNSNGHLKIDFQIHRLWYFREDIGLNIHHWHWHLVFPFDGPDQIVRKDRRGELFYYMHQQVLFELNIFILASTFNDNDRHFISIVDSSPLQF